MKIVNQVHTLIIDLKILYTKDILIFNMEHKKNLWINFFFFLSDLFASVLASVIAVYIRLYLPIGGKAALSLHLYKNFILLLIPLLILVYLFSDQYRRNRGVSILTEFISIIRIVFFTFLAVLAVIFFYREYQFSRLFILYFFILSVLFISTGRIIIRKILRHARMEGKNLLYVVVLGETKRIKEFSKTLLNQPGFGYRIIRSFYFGEKGKDKFTPGSFKKFISSNYIDEAYIVMSSKGNTTTQSSIDICEEEGIKVKLVPDIFSLLTSRNRMTMLGGNIPIVSVSINPLDQWYNLSVKRIFDIITALIGIIVFSPLMILISLLIKITSKGPVFFLQERLGYNRKNFKMLKFRTMEIQDKTKSDTIWTKENDSRITRIGKFIRKTSFDELPQLFNVFIGQMSMVGPRPERPFFVEKFKKDIPKYMERHFIKSGITGWAQVNGWRGDTSIRKRLRADLYYMRNWSIFFDFKIIFLTVLKGILGKNAY